MGKDLWCFDICRQSLIESANVMKILISDLIELVNGQKQLAQVIEVFVCIVAIQIALIDLFKHINILPDGIVGHSLGEIACAYCDGAIDRRQALCVAYWRAKILSDNKYTEGMMAVVNLSWTECMQICPEDVYPACHNSKELVTLSGERQAMTKFLAILESDGLFIKTLDSCDFAFHTPLVSNNLSTIIYKFQDIIPKPRLRSAKWVSTSVPECHWDSDHAKFCGPNYLANNLVSPVLFHSALATYVPKHAIVIEISPHSMLKSIIKDNIGPDSHVIGLMKRNNNGRNVDIILSAIGRLYQLGHNPDISKLYPRVSYPVSRGTQSISSLIKWDHSDKWFVTKYPDYFKPNKFKIVLELNKENQFYLDHRIDDRILFPATGYIFIIWRISAYIKNMDMEEMELNLQNVKIHQPLILNNDTVRLEFKIKLMNNKFTIYVDHNLLCTGKIEAFSNFINNNFSEKKNYIDTNRKFLNKNEFYKEIKIRGYDYGKHFQNVEKIDSTGTISIVIFTGNFVTYFDSILQIFILSKQDSKLHLPIGFERFKFSSCFMKNHPSSISKSKFTVHHDRDVNVIYIDNHLEIKYSTEVTTRFTNKEKVLECYKFIQFERNLFKIIKRFDKQFNPVILDELESFLMIILENKNSEYRNILYISQKTGRFRKTISNMVKKTFKNDRYKLHYADIGQIDCNYCMKHSKMDLILINFVKLSTTIIKKLDQLIIQSGFIIAILDSISLNCLDNYSTIPFGQYFQIEIISKSKLDRYMSVVLLRKTRPQQLSDQTFVTIMTDSYEWIDIVKNQSKIIQHRPKGHNLWLLANDYQYNGILGLVNCLRKEPGYNKIRCIVYDSILKFEKG